MADFEGAIPGAGRAIAEFASNIAGIIVGLKGLHDVITGLERAVQAPIKAFQDLAKIADSTVVNLNTSFGKMMGMVGDVSEAMGGPMAAAVTVGVTAFIAVAEAAFKVAEGLFQLGLAAMPGGFEAFSLAIEYLTSVVGSIFTPVVLLVIAGMLTLADLLRGPMQDVLNAVLTDLDKWIKYAVAYVGALAEAVKIAAQIFLAVVETIAVLLPVITQLINAFTTLLKVISSVIGVQMGVSKPTFDFAGKVGELKNTLGHMPTAPGGIRGIDTSKAPELFQGNLMKVAQFMAEGVAKQGNIGFTGIGDVAKQIQMQAFQNDIQAQQLTVMQQIYNQLVGAIAAQDKKQPAAPPHMTRK